MKQIILILSCIFCASSYAVTDLEVPLEMNSFQIEYSEASKTGIIRVEGCSRCTKEIYEFSESIVVKRSGKKTTINELLKEYWKVKYPTVFLKINENQVIRISY
ncbi:hypothetical protein ACU6U9_13970 [Pseudomonas sp. HK3]